MLIRFAEIRNLGDDLFVFATTVF